MKPSLMGKADKDTPQGLLETLSVAWPLTAVLLLDPGKRLTKWASRIAKESGRIDGIRVFVVCVCGGGIMS